MVRIVWDVILPLLFQSIETFSKMTKGSFFLLASSQERRLHVNCLLMMTVKKGLLNIFFFWIDEEMHIDHLSLWRPVVHGCNSKWDRIRSHLGNSEKNFIYFKSLKSWESWTFLCSCYDGLYWLRIEVLFEEFLGLTVIWQFSFYVMLMLFAIED